MEKICEIIENVHIEYAKECFKHDDFSPMSSDHFNGTCVVLFSGDKQDCMSVKEYIGTLLNNKFGL